MNSLTPLGKIVAGFAGIAMFIMVLGFAGYIETLPNPTTPASLDECDAIYHAVYILDGNPAQASLVSTGESLGCPFTE